MNILVKNSRTKITDQDEILQETFLFYKTVYAKRVCTEADLFDPLNKFQVPKLEDADNILLERQITYDELLFCLKIASNNTSPGFDGYTYEFFKIFWKDLGHFLLRAINRCFVKGELSESLRRGVITCLPKGSKDKQLKKKTGDQSHY